MGVQKGRGRARAALLAGWIALASSCDAPGPAPERPGPESAGIASDDAPTPPATVPPVARDPIRCEEVTEENTPDGAARIRFERLTVGMMADQCGRVVAPNDSLKLARYLQRRLEREPGCAGCQINRVDHVILLNVELSVLGEWRAPASSSERRFFTFMPSELEVAPTPEPQLEGAHFYFMRGGEAFEAYYDALCPGSSPDPTAPGPREVSDDCMRFTETLAPQGRRPGLWEADEP